MMAYWPMYVGRHEWSVQLIWGRAVGICAPEELPRETPGQMVNQLGCKIDESVHLCEFNSER